MKTEILILTFCIIVAFSQATPAIVPRPQINKTFKVNHTQQLQEQNIQSLGCAYLVTIKTSCISPPYTRDQISLEFGGAYGFKVYVERLGDPASGTFQRCLTDELNIAGPCIDQICQLYLYRSGLDGWVPERVTVSDFKHLPITFDYNTDIPEGGGLGFNHCG